MTFPDNMLHGVLFLVLTFLGQNAGGSEIINGHNADKNTMMYMASVQNESHHHICGGFLVTDQFVLTAAHCDEGRPKSVVLGTHNLKAVDDQTMRYKVTKCKHPDYTNVSNGFDIMLLKLYRKVHLVQPIQLPKSNVQLKENQQCRVAGWGAMKTNGTHANHLQVVDVPIISQEECLDAWKKDQDSFEKRGGIICAGGCHTAKGFCQGDSGGPLVCDGIPVGVVSTNRKGNCTYPNVPNLYTDITKFLNWINNVTNNNNNGC